MPPGLCPAIAYTCCCFFRFVQDAAEKAAAKMIAAAAAAAAAGSSKGKGGKTASDQPAVSALHQVGLGTTCSAQQLCRIIILVQQLGIQRAAAWRTTVAGLGASVRVYSN